MAAGDSCILKDQISKNLQEVADFFGYSVESTRKKIQEWQQSTGKDFETEYSKQPGRTKNDIVQYLRRKHSEEHRLTTKGILSHYKKIFKEFTPQQITDGVQLILQMCDEGYKQHVAGRANPNTREEYFGSSEYVLYKFVKQSLINNLNDPDGATLPNNFVDSEGYAIELDDKQVELLSKMLQKFDSFWQFAKLKMKTTQGITMDTSYIGAEEAADLSDDQLSTMLDDIEKDLKISDPNVYDAENSFDYETKTKESWQEVKEFLKPMKQLSIETRRMMSGIHQYDANGNRILSAFGIPRLESPHRMHKKAIDLCYNVKSESKMIDRFEQASSNGDYQIEELLSVINVESAPEEQQGYIHYCRTALFIDMQKTPMDYRISKIRRFGQRIVQNITSINASSAREGNTLWGRYRQLLNADQITIASGMTVFDKNGNIKQNHLKELKKLRDKLYIDRNADVRDDRDRTKKYFERVDSKQAIRDVSMFLTSLGIKYDKNQISRLMSGTSNDKYTLISNMFDVLDFMLHESRPADQHILDRLTASPIQGRWEINAAMSQIFRIANKGNFSVQKQFRSYGSYMNPNKGYVEYQTAQQRGFLTDIFSDISLAVEQTLEESNLDEKKQFKVNYVHEWIKEHYFQDPMFVEYKQREKDKDGNPIGDPELAKDAHGDYIIHNVWLRELWNSAKSVESLSNPNGFANKFVHYQYIGSEKDMGQEEGYTSNQDHSTFEDFSSIQQLSLLMNAFVAPNSDPAFKGRQGKQEARTFADYPTFILGDSGKQKFIRSRKYSVEDILKNLQGVVMQEIEFIKQQTLFQEDLVERGYKPVANLYGRLMRNDGIPFYRFETFPELNDEVTKIVQQNNIDVTTDHAMDDIMAKFLPALPDMIKKIMEDRMDNFKKKCQESGILNTEIEEYNNNEYEVYPYLPLSAKNGYPIKRENSVVAQASNEEQMDKFLQDFYYNSTFAMIEQIQMTTLSPLFYESAVDMQKRYKQVHASGKRPSLEARDYKGEFYMQRNGRYDTSMQYIAINDVLGNPGNGNNKEFMDAVAYTYGRYSQEFEDWLKRNPNATENQKYKKAVNIGEKFPNYAKFASTSYTDGQGYRTLESYRKVKGALGAWSRADEAAYEKILDIRKSAEVRRTMAEQKARQQGKSDSEILKAGRDAARWTEEELYEVAQITKGWQPIKPFAYGFERIATATGGDGSRVSIPTQIKCSECVIIPELLPQDSRVGIIAEYLESNHIDCAYFDSCIKVGAFGQGESYYVNNPDNTATRPNKENSLKGQLKKGKQFEKMSADMLRQVLNGNPENSYRFMCPLIHTLNYNDYVEQNSVPEHIYNQRSIGTQMRKIFFDGLKDKNFSSYIGGNMITLPNGEKATLESKEQLIKFYSSLHCANVQAQFESLMKIIENDAKLSAELQKIALTSSNETMTKLLMYATHTVVSGEEFNIPLFENSIEHDAAATLISILKKASTQLQIAGGSLVQASAYGISGLEYTSDENDLKVIIEDNNVKVFESEQPFVQEWTDKNGKKHKLNFEDWCDKDGYPLKDKDGNVLLEKYFPGSTEMIVYRIPSEKDYSAAVVRVKRFTKPIEGGIIRLPLQITTITGADFDIDKMFLMRKQFVQHHSAQSFDEFVEQQYSNSVREKVWEHIYNQGVLGISGQSIKDALEQARTNAIQTASNQKEINAIKKRRLHSFWNEAVDIIKERQAYERPIEFFSMDDGKYHFDKQEIFEAAVSQVSPQKNINKYKKEYNYRWVEYDFNRPVDRQYRNKEAAKRGTKTDVVVRNNMMLQLMQARLQDPDTMQSRTTPGGFANAEDGAKVSRYLGIANREDFMIGDKFDWNAFRSWMERTPDPNENRNYADPMTLIEFNNQNQIAAKLVGTFANINSFKAMLNSVSDVRLKNPIKMFGRNATSLVKDEKGRNSSLYVAELLAAAVDSVKNPTLKFLNITQSTAYVAGTMAMAGFTHEEIGIFLNQPIVREITKYCEQNKCGLNTAIGAIMAKHYPNAKMAIKPSLLTKDNLAGYACGIDTKDLMTAGENNVAFNDTQIAVLSALQDLVNTSATIKSYLNATKLTSANSIQSTYGSLYNIQQSIQALDEIKKEDQLVTIIPYSSKTRQKGPINPNLDIMSDDYMDQVLDTMFPIEQVVYDAVKKFISETQKFFPYDNKIFKGAREFFRKFTETGILTAKTNDLIHKEVQNWVMNRMPNCLFNNAQIRVNGELMDASDYFLTEFPTEFKLYMNEHADEYPTLFECLTVDEYNHINLDLGFDRDGDKDSFTNEWRKLIENNKNQGNLNVGECLYFYNFHANEFKFGSTTFDFLFPQDMLPTITVGFLDDPVTRVAEPITYKDVLDAMKSDQIDELTDRFKIHFYQRNYNNNEVVKQIFNKEQANILLPPEKVKARDTNTITIETYDEETRKKFQFMSLKVDKESQTITYPPALYVRGSLYIAVTDGVIDSTVPIGGSVVYTKYDIKNPKVGAKPDESNTPLDGEFLEPVSWDNLQSITANQVNIKLIRGIQNKIMEELREEEFGGEIMQSYLEFTGKLIDAMRSGVDSIDTVQIIQNSYKVLESAYRKHSGTGLLSADMRDALRESNRNLILQVFTDIMCPGISDLNGAQRSDIYSIVHQALEGVDINNKNIAEVREIMINTLTANQQQITDVTSLVEQANEVLNIAANDNGDNPLLRVENNNVLNRCR